jgi:hypothetical protein
MIVDTENYVIDRANLVKSKTLLTSIHDVLKDPYDVESTEYLIHLIDLILTDYKIDIREHVAEEFLVYYSMNSHEIVREAYINLLRGIGGLL